ncbi:neutral zinc metallopeptidase [uncultured Arthrobacter sp.]|uniref:neutral zinc metallopeptidase n=1 Tax=uncultured Arthrobacter sp. TaxID=114050 RepID=UPI0025F06797|nr:neutral zinc metallopeptidase [uncultured Arthrobacter sp.]
MRAYLLTVLRDLDRKWTAWFDENGFGKPEVYYTMIREGKTHASNCRNPRTLHRIAVEHDHPNAYYCPADPYDPGDPTGALGTSDSDNGMIILPVTTLQRLWDADRGAGGTGDFAVALVLAHEFGHHVQDELAIHWFEKFAVPIPEFTGAHKELIADCFAGAWAASWQTPGSLGAPAVNQALASAAAMGARQPGAGYGSGRERREAFLLGAAGKGFASGPQACLTVYWG